MLSIGVVRSGCCNGVSRRALVEAGAIGAFGLSWADWLLLRAHGESTRAPVDSVIVLWLWGGPSHLDTFDMKPAAPAEYRGPWTPIATRVPGIEICELLPKHAPITDRLAIVRSMHHTSNDHGVAGTIALTGSEAGAVNLGGAVASGSARPCIGSIVGRFRSTTDSKVAGSALPNFMVIGGKLHQGKKPIVGEGGGTLGGKYDPFRLEYDPEEGARAPSLALAGDLPIKRLEDRRELLRAIDTIERRNESAPVKSGLHQQAFALLTSGPAKKAFDISAEREAVRDRYGRYRFGQACLLARRLVEHGVPFVQVNWSAHVEAEEDSGDGGWDMHYRNFEVLQDRHLWMYDQTYTALLGDLFERGLLDRTLVVAMGEFGRTPKINAHAGRDHWEKCYSAVFAGGGIRGGTVTGASDSRGELPKVRPITPADVAATILERVGISAAALQQFQVQPEGHAIAELV